MADLNTFGIWNPFACMVAKAAQHTRALELDKPALGGMVPSVMTFIPTGDPRVSHSTMPRKPHRK